MLRGLDVSQTGPELRHVSTARDLHPQIFMGRFVGEIFFDPPAQSAGVVANDVVLVGIVAFATSEDTNTYLLLSDLRSFTPNMTVAYIEQEVGEQARPAQAAAGCNTLCKLPAGVAEDSMQVDLR
jgi:hypothetical protein